MGTKISTGKVCVYIKGNEVIGKLLYVPRQIYHIKGMVSCEVKNTSKVRTLPRTGSSQWTYLPNPLTTSPLSPYEDIYLNHLSFFLFQQPLWDEMVNRVVSSFGEMVTVSVEVIPPEFTYSDVTVSLRVTYHLLDLKNMEVRSISSPDSDYDYLMVWKGRLFYGFVASVGVLNYPQVTKGVSKKLRNIKGKLGKSFNEVVRNCLNNRSYLSAVGKEILRCASDPSYVWSNKYTTTGSLTSTAYLVPDHLRPKTIVFAPGGGYYTYTSVTQTVTTHEIVVPIPEWFEVVPEETEITEFTPSSPSIEKTCDFIVHEPKETVSYVIDDTVMKELRKSFKRGYLFPDGLQNGNVWKVTDPRWKSFFYGMSVVTLKESEEFILSWTKIEDKYDLYVVEK